MASIENTVVPEEDPAALVEENDTIAEANLSKTARKKLLRKQKRDQLIKEKKAARKEAQKEAVAKKREEAQAVFETLTEEEKAEKIAIKRQLVDSRKQQAAEKKQKQKQAYEHGQHLLLDLEFDDKMSEKELCSLNKQLMYCYSANTKATTPVRLVMTGLSGRSGEMYKEISGVSNWLVDAQPETYMDVYKDRLQDLVYLTADSPNVCHELDPKKVYIVGGIVDHNRYKNLTLDKAEGQGIQHAHLPIGEDLKMITSRVLTVNQVVEILLSFLDTKDWKQALQKVIPKRKREDESDGEEESSGRKTSAKLTSEED